jgi:hypothetical protein
MIITAGCVEVEHDHDDPTALVSLLRGSLRGSEIASNGEIVQIGTAAELTRVCAAHPGREVDHDELHPCGPATADSGNHAVGGRWWPL